MATEPLTPAQYAWQSSDLIARIEHHAANASGAERMTTAFWDAHDQALATLTDLTAAYDKQGAPVMATGAIVTERQRCICRDICLDHCRACNHSGRDLEECCIADPEWEPDDEYLAIREARKADA